MAKVLKRPVPDEPVPIDRAKVMRDYTERQSVRGNVQVKVWLPAHMKGWLYQMAEDARILSRTGIDPLERLPKALIPTSEVA